ncbi:hypothetical protein CPLU01_01408 [Colletotrichum plurivorum]|uniref:Uncharacterized protein n=1 Tax=Colletotrichum plurivorum TaxID=2175906 RepID=A0A8H6NPF0_9PEZI|nr:hypothetical protein CPLU01_01408 [Colletotrichum plurivorum]
MAVEPSTVITMNYCLALFTIHMMTRYAYGEGQGGADHEMMDIPALSTWHPARRRLSNKDLALLTIHNSSAACEVAGGSATLIGVIETDWTMERATRRVTWF